MKVRLVKRSQFKGRMGGKADAAAATSDFILFDNEDSTFTVYGVTAAGNPVDISSVATLTPAPTSSDTSVLTVDPPVGMTFKVVTTGKLSTPGTPVVITATATWNDGSKGPFSFDQPVDVQSDPNSATGIVIVPGTPVPKTP